MAHPPAAAASSAAGREAVCTPTLEIIGYARRLRIRQYHAPPQDIDDLMGQALLEDLVGFVGEEVIPPRP